MVEPLTRSRSWAERQTTTGLTLTPYLSVVVPIYNEELNIPALKERLIASLDAIGKPWELVLIDDGSRDRSLELLREFAQADSRITVVELNRNFGQHAAILAGFEQTRGEVIVTLDADLQNPPEEIAKLVEAMEQGHDAVGGVRVQRHDSLARKLPSRVINKIIRHSTGVQMRDYGCMLRAYRRDVVENILQYGEAATFIPALANLFAHSAVEVPVGHADRAAGESKYGIRKLLRLAFDLMTGFSLFPIQLVAVAGALIATLGMGFGLFLLTRRFIVGAEVEGVFTLFAVLFVFVGLQFFAMAIIGEYIGRIYYEVRHRPRFLVRKIYRRDA